MGSLASISKTVLFCGALTLLFSSETMKIQGDIVKIQIPWNDPFSEDFTCDEAIFPDEFDGLPLFSILLEQENVSEIAVLNIVKNFQIRIDLYFSYH